MANADELPDAQLDAKLHELLEAIAREQVSPKLLDLVRQLQIMLDRQSAEMSRQE